MGIGVLHATSLTLLKFLSVVQELQEGRQEARQRQLRIDN
jgi:hypothetical protein